MYLWTPVMRGKCTFAELKTAYTLDDLADLHELIRLEDAITSEAQDRANRGSKAKPGMGV